MHQVFLPEHVTPCGAGTHLRYPASASYHARKMARPMPPAGEKTTRSEKKLFSACQHHANALS